jgi:hypothetical protein
MKNAALKLVSAMLSVWLIAMAPAAAEVTAVDPSPDAFAVTMDQASSVRITWRIQRSGASTGAVSSDRGQLIIAGRTISIGRRLVRRITNEPSVVIVETLLIPRSVLVELAKSGGSLTGVYRREFTDGDGGDGGGVAAATTSIEITTGGGADFGISRLDLKFLDDDSRATVRAEGSRLRATARIRFTGSGLLHATWQVATPATTPGEEIFQPLRLERRQLSGNGAVELVSPYLPTSMQGQYLVALTVRQPQLGFDTPRLIYTILPTADPQVQSAPGSLLAYAVREIRVAAPAVNTVLDPATKIVWLPVGSAAVYRISLVDPGLQDVAPQPDLRYGAPPNESAVASPPVAGFYVPGTTAEAVMPAAVVGRLTSGRGYLLQIQALDSAGVVIAESIPLQVYWR